MQVLLAKAGVGGVSCNDSRNSSGNVNARMKRLSGDLPCRGGGWESEGGTVAGLSSNGEGDRGVCGGTPVADLLSNGGRKRRGRSLSDRHQIKRNLTSNGRGLATQMGGSVT
jgi:hypothetical protein